MSDKKYFSFFFGFRITAVPDLVLHNPTQLSGTAGEQKRSKMAGDIPDNEALNQGKSFQVSKIFILSKNRLNDFFDPLDLNVLFV